jgi:hypothetical protein
VKSITFDWNCLIAVEQSEPASDYVQALVEAHKAGKISVGITTVSASETLKGSKSFPASASQFTERLKALGWEELDLVLGPAVIGLTYYDMCKYVDEAFEAERDAIWATMFPHIPQKQEAGNSEPELWSASDSKWRNAWCDVHTLWTHIDSGRDVFVTMNTHDFQRHSDDLLNLGLTGLMTPEEAMRSFAR